MGHAQTISPSGKSTPSEQAQGSESPSPKEGRRKKQPVEEQNQRADESPRPKADLVKKVRKDLEDKSLTLFVAPAGFGKTACLLALRSQGADSGNAGDEDDAAATEQSDCNACSKNSADPHKVFVDCVGLVSDEKMISDFLFENCSTQLTGWKSADETRDGAPLNEAGSIRRLTRALKAYDKKIILMIDEYHLVASSATDACLREVMMNLPGNVRVVVAARRIPKIGVQKMLMQGRAAVYGLSEFAFAADDVAALFNDGQDVKEISEPEVDTLARLSGGWPASLKVAQDWLKREDLPGDRASYFMTALEKIFPYLEEEVYCDVPAGVQAVMEELSILPVFDADAVRAIFGQTNSEDLILQLPEIDAFAVPVDQRRETYRFHPLMRRFLETRLISQRGRERVAELCQSAAAYYARRGEWARAAIFAWRTGDAEFFCEILSHENVNLRTLGGDPDLFDELMGRIKNNPEFETAQLLPSLALYVLREGDAERAKGYLEKGHAQLASMEGKTSAITNSDARMRHLHIIYALEMDLALIDAFHDIYTDPKSSEGYLQKLRGIDMHARTMDPMYHGILYNALSFLFTRKGLIAQAHAYLDLAISSFDKAGSHFSLILNNFHAGMLNILEGKLIDAMDRFEPSDRLLQARLPERDHLAALTGLGRATCYFEWGEPERSFRIAPRVFDAIIDGNDCWPDVVGQVCRLAARATFAVEGFDAAERVVLKGVGLAHQRGYVHTTTGLQGLHIHLAAIAGKNDKCEELCSSYGKTFKDVTFDEELGFGWREQSYLAIALIRKLINEEEPAEALEIINRLKPAYEQNGLKWFALKMTVLEALAEYSGGQNGEAEEGKRRAAELARPIINLSAQDKGVCSVLLEEGDLARELLREAAYRYRRISQNTDGIKDNIIAALEKWYQYNEHLIDRGKPLPKLKTKHTDILKMVAENCSYKEMCVKTGAKKASVFQVIEALQKKFDVETREELSAWVRYVRY